MAAVTPVAAFAVVGLVAGGIRRGRLAWALRARPKLWGLAAAALAVTAVADASGAGGGFLGFELAGVPGPVLLALVGMGVGLAFVASNLTVGGMAVIGTGIAANLVPLVANRATPVRGEALVRARIVAAEDVDRAVLDGPREIADSGTVLEILGDVIPVPPLGLVVSFGDLIILVGLAAVIHNLMRRRPAGALPQGAEQVLAVLNWSPPPTAPEPAWTPSPTPTPEPVLTMSPTPTPEPALTMSPNPLPTAAEPSMPITSSPTPVAEPVLSMSPTAPASEPARG